MIKLYEIDGARLGYYLRVRVMPRGRVLVSIEQPRTGTVIWYTSTNDETNVRQAMEELLELKGLEIRAHDIDGAVKPLTVGRLLSDSEALDCELLRIFGMVMRGSLDAQDGVKLVRGVLGR